MSLLPLSQAVANNAFQKIRLIATDMDGTLTTQEKFTSKLLETLETLAEIKLPVIIVTGRSAGWVDGVRNYLPVAGAIAENGGLFFPQHQEFPELITPISDLTLHRQKLAQTFQSLKTQFPQLQEAADNRFRLTDWTFDVRGLTLTQLQTLSQQCQQQGWGFTYSTVQCHIKPAQQEKARSLLQVLSQYFPQFSPDEIITVGDSPNDESLFNKNNFPLSVGVANLQRYLQQMEHHPVYFTSHAEGEGFCELAQIFIH